MSTSYDKTSIKTSEKIIIIRGAGPGSATDVKPSIRIYLVEPRTEEQRPSQSRLHPRKVLPRDLVNLAQEQHRVNRAKIKRPVGMTNVVKRAFYNGNMIYPSRSHAVITMFRAAR